MSKQTRRRYTDEFKADAVRLVESEGYGLTEAARRLGVERSCLARWRREVRGEAPVKAEPVSTEEKDAELRRLREKVRKLLMERDIFKKGDGLLRERVELRYPFIEAEKAVYPVKVLCHVTQVSRSGFSDWVRRGDTDSEREQLVGRVREIPKRKRGSFGSRRMAPALQRDGFAEGRHQARNLMQEAEVDCRQRRRYRSTTDSGHGRPVAPNLLVRQFEVADPNRAWCADITAIWTLEGWLYLAGARSA